MKKLLISMLSAAALVGVASAADTLIEKSSDFEAYTVGEFKTTAVENENTVGEDAPYWVLDADETGTIATEGNSENANKYLQVGGATLQRNVLITGAEQAKEENKEIFFESRVQFTAAEEAPTVTENDKLIVWLYASDSEEGAFGIGTNLMVTANTVDAGYLTDAATHYVLSGVTVPKAGVWTKLKIQTVTANFYPKGTETVGVPAFEIYVGDDEVKAVVKDVEDGAAGVVSSQFPSLISSLTGVASVTLSGEGSVDDLAFYHTTIDDEGGEGGDSTVNHTFTLTATFASSLIASINYAGVNLTSGTASTINIMPLDAAIATPLIVTLTDANATLTASNGAVTSPGTGFWMIMLPAGDVTAGNVELTLTVVTGGEITESMTQDAAQQVVSGATTDTTITTQNGEFAVDSTGKTITFTANDKTLTLTVKAYHKASVNETKKEVTLELDGEEVFSFGATTETVEGTTITTPAITVGTDGSFQLNIQRAYKTALTYTLKGATTLVNGGDWADVTGATTEGGANDGDAMKLKAPAGCNKNFFKVFVEEVK